MVDVITISFSYFNFLFVDDEVSCLHVLNVLSLVRRVHVAKAATIEANLTDDSVENHLLQ